MGITKEAWNEIRKRETENTEGEGRRKMDRGGRGGSGRRGKTPVMRSESPQVKTRPGLRISTRTHQDHYAITATHLLPSFHRCLGPPRPRFPYQFTLLNRSKFSNYHNRPLALRYGGRNSPTINGSLRSVCFSIGFSID